MDFNVLPVMVSRLNRWMFCIRKIAAKASGQKCAILHLTYKYYYEQTALGLIIQSVFFVFFYHNDYVSLTSLGTPLRQGASSADTKHKNGKSC